MTATNACKLGHEYTPENLRIVTIRGKETRQCRQCDKDRAQAKRDRLRGDKVKCARPLKEQCFRGHPLEGDNLYLYETKWGTAAKVPGVRRGAASGADHIRSDCGSD